MSQSSPIASTSRSFTPIAKLRITRDSITNTTGGVDQPLSAPLLSVLEVFTHDSMVDQAFKAYRNATDFQSSPDVTRLSGRLDVGSGSAVLVIVGKRIGVAPLEFADIAYNLANASNVLHWNPDAATLERLYEQTRIADLTSMASNSVGVAAAVAQSFGCNANPSHRFDREAFDKAVSELYEAGVLTLPVNNIDFGDFRRFTPFCADYGFTRGTPIDRYYLNQFSAHIRSEVKGDVLEIGGRLENQQTYGFQDLKSYSAMELQAQPNVDLVGDAHQLSACEAESRDSILLFNVLEHCESPFRVLQNTLQWLRPGGKVFCVVPNAQRMHRDPKDYWRIYPDAFDSMLTGYTGVRITTYGNLLACHASLSGICAEELSAHDLEFRDGRYPVITCAVAQKPESLN